MGTIKKYTQEEFDAFEVVNGYKICPMGDYSEIKDFGDGCKFDAWCYFGARCSFGERCIFGEGCGFCEGCCFENKGKYIGAYPFIAFEGFGSRVGSKMYVYNLETGIYVRCGCWLSTIAEFRQRVKDEQADSYYLDCADLAERKFNK